MTPTTAPSAAITATACQMAEIDGRRGDLAVILDGLDGGQLREVVGELLTAWLLAARFTGCNRADIRAAIEADAYGLAARR